VNLCGVTFCFPRKPFSSFLFFFDISPPLLNAGHPFSLSDLEVMSEDGLRDLPAAVSSFSTPGILSVNSRFAGAGRVDKLAVSP